MPRNLTAEEASDLMISAFTNPSSAGNNPIAGNAGAGFRWVVYGYQIANNAATANTVHFTSNAQAICSNKNLAANAGTNVPANPAVPLFVGNDGGDLQVNLSAATAVGVDVQYLKARVQQ